MQEEFFLFLHFFFPGGRQHVLNAPVGAPSASLRPCGRPPSCRPLRGSESFASEILRLRCAALRMTASAMLCALRSARELAGQNDSQSSRPQEGRKDDHCIRRIVRQTVSQSSRPQARKKFDRFFRGPAKRSVSQSSRPQARKKFDRFFRGHAPRKKHRSPCKCASVPRKRVRAAGCKPSG